METICFNNKKYVILKSVNNRFAIAKDSEVINVETKRIIKPYIGTDCYEHIVLHYKGKKYRKRVHRLMAEAYFNNTKYIDHIDNNKSNNDITNLRPISNKENIVKGMQDATKYHGNVGWFKSLKIKAIDKNTKEEFVFESMRKCEKFTGVDRHRIKTFLRNERPNYTKYTFKLLQD
jgi:hypothetical protein